MNKLNFRTPIHPFMDRSFADEFFSPIKKQTGYYTGEGEGTVDSPWVIKESELVRVEKVLHAWYDEDGGFHKVPQKEIEE